MKSNELYKHLQALDLPLAYHHFEEGHSPKPPFMVYYYPDSLNFGADNIAYHKGLSVVLEVYTDKKDLDLEGRVEDFLDRHSFYFDKVETYIASEKLYQEAYYFEL